jgi:hypothetical protein
MNTNLVSQINEIISKNDFWDQLFFGPIAERRNQWIKEVEDVLTKLQREHSIDASALTQNNAFIDTFLLTASYAVRTNVNEKIQAFKSALLNTALKPEEYNLFGIVFLNLINAFTIWHIRLLHLFDNPRIWFQKNEKNPPNLAMGGLSNVIFTAYPDIDVNLDLLDLIWNDLKSAGLQNSAGLRTSMSGSGIMEGRLTDLGKLFLKFISTS